MSNNLSRDIDDLSKVKYIQYVLIFLTVVLNIAIRLNEKTLITFGFIVELVFLVLIFRSHTRAIINTNFTYWGISFLILVYLARVILHHTFIEYNLLILYLAFLDLTALLVNSYIMSSPLYYPSVQWWEYDFRFRGDMKAVADVGGESLNSRLTDLRREACCVELFEMIEVGSEIKVSVNHNDKLYAVEGVVKTMQQHIPGRQISYGVSINTQNVGVKENYLKLLEAWRHRQKIKLRSKFKNLKNGIDL